MPVCKGKDAGVDGAPEFSHLLIYYLKFSLLLDRRQKSTDNWSHTTGYNVWIHTRETEKKYYVQESYYRLVTHVTSIHINIWFLFSLVNHMIYFTFFKFVLHIFHLCLFVLIFQNFLTYLLLPLFLHIYPFLSLCLSQSLS